VQSTANGLTILRPRRYTLLEGKLPFGHPEFPIRGVLMFRQVVSTGKLVVLSCLLSVLIFLISGCESPSSPLPSENENVHIKGNLTVEGLTGLGTEKPQQRLHVAGSLQLEGSLICTDCIDSSAVPDGAIGLVDLAPQDCGVGNVIQGWPDGKLTCVNVGTGGPAGWALSGNASTNPASNFLGTTDNVALEVRVDNQRVLRLEPAYHFIFGFSPNLIGGYSENSVTAGVSGATISGGGRSDSPNRVTDNHGTVGGGRSNQAGNGNLDSTDAARATVGGGSYNLASGLDSTVSGGRSNTASRDGSTVGGGETNTAGGRWATVPGGRDNVAAGDYSFAAGQRARADHQGTFVWADSTDEDFSSSSANQFNVRASGGTRIFSSADLSTGVKLAPGGGSWSSASDRNLKENFTAVDGREILERLSLIPISEWNLKSQETGIRHIGPTAQDFYAAFGLGESDLYINSSDADGIALISIQALYQLSLERDRKISQLEETLQKREREIDELRARLEALEAIVKEIRESALEAEMAPVQ
jgi:hypothetical protein